MKDKTKETRRQNEKGSRNVWYRKSKEEKYFKKGENQKDLTTIEKQSYGSSIFTATMKSSMAVPQKN